MTILGVEERHRSAFRRMKHLHSSIIGICAYHEVGGFLVGMLDHLKEAHSLGHAVDGPGGIEDMMSAML